MCFLSRASMLSSLVAPGKKNVLRTSEISSTNGSGVSSGSTFSLDESEPIGERFAKRRLGNLRDLRSRASLFIDELSVSAAERAVLTRFSWRSLGAGVPVGVGGRGVIGKGETEGAEGSAPIGAHALRREMLSSPSSPAPSAGKWLFAPRANASCSSFFSPISSSRSSSETVERRNTSFSHQEGALSFSLIEAAVRMEPEGVEKCV